MLYVREPSRRGRLQESNTANEHEDDKMDSYIFYFSLLLNKEPLCYILVLCPSKIVRIPVVDKEIEDLLHSLNISADFPSQQEIPVEKTGSFTAASPSAHSKECIEPKTGVFPSNDGKKKKFSRSFWQWGALGAAVLGAITALGALFFKEQPQPIRLVYSSEQSTTFFQKKTEGIESNVIFLREFPEQEKTAEEPFFVQKPPLGDQLFADELHMNAQLLNEQKKALFSGCAALGVLTEKESLRSLLTIVEKYLRTHLFLSAAFEEKIEEREAYMHEEEKKPWNLFLHLYGGKPFHGCFSLLEESNRLKKSFDKLLSLLQQENVSLEEQAFIVMRSLKVLEKKTADPLVLLLFDEKEERKKLDEAIISLLTRFETQKEKRAWHSIQEWRAFCFLTWCVSKKPVVDWRVCDDTLSQGTRFLLVEERNVLSREESSFWKNTKRIDW